MAIDLKKILFTMKKTYSFNIKIACDDIKDYDFKSFDTIMGLKGMIKRTNPVALPLASAPLDFPRLKSYYGTIYKFEAEFEYPISENQIKTELSNLLCLDRSFIIVRTSESPLEQYDDDYLKYKDEDYASVLLDDAQKDSVNPNDYYGDEYNKSMIDALLSKEGQENQQHFKEVDKNTYNGQK